MYDIKVDRINNKTGELKWQEQYICQKKLPRSLRIILSDIENRLRGNFIRMDWKPIVVRNILSVSLYSHKTGKVTCGTAYCDKRDKFDFDFGRALATCRAASWKALEQELLDAKELEDLIYKRE